MTTIESGPTKERRVRTSLFFLMFAVFAGMFLYDGWIGYPGQNFREHLEALPVELRDDAAAADRVYDSVTEQSIGELRPALNKFDAESQRQALEDLFGHPPSYETAEALYYFGPVWRVRINLSKSGKLKTPAVPSKAKQTATSIAWQKGLGVGLAVVSLIILLHLIRVFRTRVVLDEAGLHFTGQGPIAWEDMRSLKTEKFEKKGCIDLVYQGSGAERTLRLDEYHLAGFPAVVAEICSRKGLEDPVALEKARKQEEAQAS